MNWSQRSTIAALKLKKQNHELALKLLRVREQLQKSERYTSGLEVVLQARLTRISKLNGIWLR